MLPVTEQEGDNRLLIKLLLFNLPLTLLLLRKLFSSCKTFIWAETSKGKLLLSEFLYLTVLFSSLTCNHKLARERKNFHKYLGGGKYIIKSEGAFTIYLFCLFVCLLITCFWSFKKICGGKILCGIISWITALGMCEMWMIPTAKKHCRKKEERRTFTSPQVK